jgi:hypothetical protein
MTNYDSVSGGRGEFLLFIEQDTIENEKPPASSYLELRLSVG